MNWSDVEALGYTVQDSAAGVKFVSGFGVATYVAVDDQEQIDSLADPVLHAQRIAPPVDIAQSVATAQVAALPPDASLADVIAYLNAQT